MPEIGSVVSLKVRELPEESGNLSDDPKEVIRSGMIMHLEPFDGFVILDNRVKRSFFEFLPISAKIVFGVRIEQQKEILDI